MHALSGGGYSVLRPVTDSQTNGRAAAAIACTSEPTPVTPTARRDMGAGAQQMLLGALLAKVLALWRPGAARCLQSRPDLLAHMLSSRRTSTDGLELAVLHGRVDVAAVLLSEHGVRAEGLPLLLALSSRTNCQLW